MPLVDVLWKILASGFLAGGLLGCDAPAERIEADQPKLSVTLMTSLPIIWGEGGSMADILSEDREPAPIFQHWRKKYKLEALDSLEGLQNSQTDLILLAQPPAMDPADLSDLDAWVRAGGNVVILTDPMLQWHSSFPIGDNRRPLATGLLSPLLSHWGLELMAPDEEGEGLVSLEFAELIINTAGVGSFRNAPANSPECNYSDRNVIAFCSIGKGNAILVADADFLNAELWLEQRGDGTRSSDAMKFVDGLIGEAMEKRRVSND